MDKAEPLIAEYNLQDWMNPMMSGSHDIEKRCHPVLEKPIIEELLETIIKDGDGTMCRLWLNVQLRWTCFASQSRT